MKHVCANCAFALGFGPGLGISGTDEVVKCSNLDLINFLDKIQKSDSYYHEFKEQGYINIFRVEAVSTNEAEECKFWMEKRAK